MNPSTDDILDAIAKVYADTIFVFPNNKNIIMAAEQAAKISDKNVLVIPAKSIPQCVAALVSFNGEKTPEENETKMNKALSKVKTGQVTFAVRDTEIEGQKISEGDILGIADGKIKSVTDGAEKTCEELVSVMADDESEFVTIYYGEDTKKEDAEMLLEKLEEEYEDIEFSLQYGGQSLYYYIISVE